MALSLKQGLWCLLLPIMLFGLAPGVGAHGPHHQATSEGPCETTEVPALRCARSVNAHFDASGAHWVTWYQHGHVYVQRFRDQKPLTDPVAVNRIPEAVDDQGEDQPRLLIGADNTLYVLWTRKLQRRFTGHIRLARSLDAGQRFDGPWQVNDDDDEIGHRFPNFLLDDQQRLLVFWIDKRDQERARAEGRGYPGAALYYAASEDRGEHFSASRRLLHHSCECCRLALAHGDNGQPLLFYRHVFEGHIRDHALLQFNDDGTPADPRRATFDDWHIQGCPHQGPAMARQGDTLHLAWFTAGPHRQGLFHARHRDGDTEPARYLGGAGSGQPALIALENQVALAWKDLEEGQTVVRAQFSGDGGEHWSTPSIVLRTRGASDHPQLLTHQGKIFLGWHRQNEGYRLLPLEIPPTPGG